MTAPTRRSTLLAVALFLALGAGSARAFAPSPRPGFAARGGAAAPPSRTRANLFDFLKDGKKALVRSLAGEYDAPAVRERIDGLVKGNPVLMFSFRT